MSGHAYVIGAQTYDIIGFMVKSRSFSKYKTANRMGVEHEEYNCVTNWDGASGEMKVGAALYLYIGSYISNPLSRIMISLCVLT